MECRMSLVRAVDMAALSTRCITLSMWFIMDIYCAHYVPGLARTEVRSAQYGLYLVCLALSMGPAWFVLSMVCS